MIAGPLTLSQAMAAGATHSVPREAKNRPQKIPNLKALPLRFPGLSFTDGEIMGTAASPLLNPIVDALKAGGPKPAAETLLRRARQRRQIQDMIGVSYVIDAAILLIYAYAGTTAAIIGPAYAACGLATIVFNI